MCKFFGHHAPVYTEFSLHNHDAEFSTLHVCGKDGMGRIIACVYADCPRCLKEYMVAKIHLPTAEDIEVK